MVEGGGGAAQGGQRDAARARGGDRRRGSYLLSPLRPLAPAHTHHHHSLTTFGNPTIHFPPFACTRASLSVARRRRRPPLASLSASPQNLALSPRQKNHLTFPSPAPPAPRASAARRPALARATGRPVDRRARDLPRGKGDSARARERRRRRKREEQTLALAIETTRRKRGEESSLPRDAPALSLSCPPLRAPWPTT